MLNLRELNITAASINGRLRLETGAYDDLVDVLGRYESRWPRRLLDKTGLYEVDEAQHHTGLEIERYGRAEPEVVLFMLGAHPFRRNERFRAPTREKQTREFAEIQMLLDDLAGLSMRGELTGHIGWLFPPETKKPIVGLPLITIQSPSVPFAEISGIRLKKRTPEGLTTVIIDLREDRSLATTLAFPLAEPVFSAHMLDDMVVKGTTIIEDFVLGSGTDTEQEGE